LTFNDQATNDRTSGNDFRFGQDLAQQGFGFNLSQALLSATTPTVPPGTGAALANGLSVNTGANGTQTALSPGLTAGIGGPSFPLDNSANSVLLASASRPATLASYSFTLMANLRPEDMVFAQLQPDALVRGGYPYTALTFGRGGSTPGVVQNNRTRDVTIRRAVSGLMEERPATEELAEPESEMESRKDVAPKDDAKPAEETRHHDEEKQMSERATTTTPDPELFYPAKQPRDTLAGGNARVEVAGCPTGLGTDEQPQSTQRNGGGGAPATGAVDVSVPASPGEGVKDE